MLFITQGKTNWKFLIVVVVLAAVAGGGILLYTAKQKMPATPVGEAQKPENVVKEETADWQTYQWGELEFKHPADWKVEENNYATAAEEAAGEPGEVVGLTISPKNNTKDEDSILFGGRQFSCGFSEFYAPNCFTFYYVPIHTYSESPEILTVFYSLIKTISYNNSNASFQILFPEAKTQLEPNKKYTIRWETKPGIQIKGVDLMAFDTSKYWKDGLVLSVDNISNSGSYEWTVPSTITSEGPYLIDISYCEPIIPSPVGTISSCKPYEGWSNPFYISISN